MLRARVELVAAPNGSQAWSLSCSRTPVADEAEGKTLKRGLLTATFRCGCSGMILVRVEFVTAPDGSCLLYTSDAADE